MKLLLTLTLLLPIFVHAQRMKRNEIDKFTKQPVIVTGTEVLRQNANTSLAVSLKAEGAKLFVVLSGYGQAATTVSAEDAAIFLLANDSTVTVKSTALQTLELGKNNKYSYSHQYGITQPQLEMLGRTNLRSVRKYHFKGYADVAVPDRNGDKLRRLAAGFLKAYAVNRERFAVPTVGPTDAVNHVGDSVRVCGKIFSGRYLSATDGKPTLLNMGAAYPAQPLTVVIWGNNRKAFRPDPEEFYKNKEVCIEGRITTYRDKAQIVVITPAQVQVQGGKEVLSQR